ncbi:MAG: trypsin-like peptidase domain-containing protein [Methylotenera sp.]|nr:trypsin-like peptidase domain-containing protein [Methylotenera sp.]
MRSALLFLITLTYISPALALDQAKILKSLQSVVMIRGYNSNGGLAYGSGVVIAKDKVVTNCHIFRTTKKPWIARGEDSYEIINVQADRWHDLCLVSAHALPFTPAPIGNSNLIKRGQEVLSIGHSNGVPSPLTSAGAIKTSYDFDGGKVIRSSAKFTMGASGSGIFDLEGNLLGINTFKTPGRPAYFYSLPIEWISQLEKLPVETQFPITGKTFWEEDDLQKPFFMQIAIPELSQDWLKLAEVAKRWIDLDPNNTEAWYELGVAQESLGQLEEAKGAYHQSILLDSGNSDALFRLGAIAQIQGDTEGLNKANVAIATIDENLAKEFNKMLNCNFKC